MFDRSIHKLWVMPWCSNYFGVEQGYSQLLGYTYIIYIYIRRNVHELSDEVPAKHKKETVRVRVMVRINVTARFVAEDSIRAHFSPVVIAHRTINWQTALTLTITLILTLTVTANLTLTLWHPKMTHPNPN